MKKNIFYFIVLFSFFSIFNVVNAKNVKKVEIVISCPDGKNRCASSTDGHVWHKGNEDINPY